MAYPLGFSKRLPPRFAAIVTMKQKREELLARMQTSRDATLDLLDWVYDPARLQRSPGSGFRPMLWHLAHVGAFEEWWLLIKLRGDASIEPRYQILFDPIRTPREESEKLPDRSEIERYLARVRSRIELVYRGNDETPGRTVDGLEEGYLFDLVLEHEYQHQETLAYLLQMLPPDCKRKPPIVQNAKPLGSLSNPTREMVKVPGAEFKLGGRPDSFVYDNEEPAHLVSLAAFRLDRLPVTNADFREFIRANGYENRGLWSDAGWIWKTENTIVCPQYWMREERWMTQEMFETVPLHPDHPVTGVSWYEAEAYARFEGKRLPTEAEWEMAAAYDAALQQKCRFSWGDSVPDLSKCNFGGHFLGPTPVSAFPGGQSSVGCLDMSGNVWEWTASTFNGYPGFKSQPYREYSELWFDGDHRVLKGGSWMTRAPLLRASFRNFFRAGFRFAFAGFRCCADD